MSLYDDEMRIGYGYGRVSEDFARAGVERLYLDTAFTDREERTSMLSQGVRPGDTIVLLAHGDLGAGAGLRAIRRRLEGMDVTVELVTGEAAGKRSPGRPSQFEPTPEQDKQIRDLWYADGVYTMKHVLQRAGDIYGKPVTRYQLDNRYGPRNGSMPDGRKRS